MNDIKYWEKFYKKQHIVESSDFAKFCLKFIPSQSVIIEFGCGNGRDSYFFAKNNHLVIGIDSANRPKNNNSTSFYLNNVKDYCSIYYIDKKEIVYNRFFLHSISDKDIDILLDWTKGLFLTEFRTKEDIPLLYTNHWRNKIDEQELLQKMINKNYEIIYFHKGRDLAKYKTENPMVARIIAKKK